MASSSSNSPRVIAVIPARGGSKGVPGKNLKKVGGITLVGRAIAAARATPGIDAVFVSTDDAAIALVSRAAGAEVIPRPEELSTDSASSEAALLHALDELGGAPDVLVFIQATSAFIDPVDLDAAVTRVLDGESDVVFAACATHAFLWKMGPEGAEGVNHDGRVRLRRQELQPQFRETGAFYVMRADGFREARFRFFGRVGVAVVDELTSLEIDTADDLALARAIEPLVAPGVRIDVDAVVTDFDGVHTDDRVHVASDGSESVTANRSDGMGVALLRRAGLPVLILSSETNPVVTARADKLQVEVVQSERDKVGALVEWAAGKGVELARTAYVGNDVNDLGCMDAVGWPIAVADAHPLVLAAARVVLSSNGGHGALRELADRILVAPGTAAAPTLEELWSRSLPTP